MVIMVSISTAAAEKRHIVIEMGEGGQTVSFLMTAKEITAIDAEKQRLSEVRKKSSVDEKQTVAYETAESGMLIEFPERVSEVNTVIIAKIENL